MRTQQTPAILSAWLALLAFPCAGLRAANSPAPSAVAGGTIIGRVQNANDQRYGYNGFSTTFGIKGTF